AEERPSSSVSMLGNNDRQSIREKAPPPAARSPGAPGAAGAKPAPVPPRAGTAQTAPAQAPAGTPAQRAQDVDPEQQPPERPAEQPPANMTPEQARVASYGPWEFHSEKWEIAYIKRVDAT